MFETRLGEAWGPHVPPAALPRVATAARLPRRNLSRSRSQAFSKLAPVREEGGYDEPSCARDLAGSAGPWGRGSARCQVADRTTRLLRGACFPCADAGPAAPFRPASRRRLRKAAAVVRSESRPDGSTRPLLRTGTGLRVLLHP